LGHVAQLVGAWVPSSNWPTDQFQGTKPVRLRVRPATEGTQPHHRRENFLYTFKAGPAARQHHGRYRGTGLTLRPVICWPRGPKQVLAHRRSCHAIADKDSRASARGGPG
jgi:hypothetical protein